MGISLLRYDRLLLQAIIASLALHLIVALVIPGFTWLHGSGPAIETLSFMRVHRISIETPHPIVHPAAATAPHFAAHPHVVRSQAAASRAAQVKSQRVIHSERKSIKSAPVVASSEVHGSSTVQTTATGIPAAPSTPQAEQIASTQTRRDTGGYLPFGAEQPSPVLDPDVLKALSELSVHTTLTVVVGEDGHTKSVAFDPEIDAHVEDQIRSMLVNASWDPAVCGGGVACEGRATIKL